MSAAPQPAGRSVDRVASRFVLLVMGVGCLLFWVAAPLGGIYLGGHLGTVFATQLVLALGLILIGMLTMSVILGWLNELYLRTTGGALVALPDGTSFRRRGPLEAVLVGSLIPLAAAIVVWLLLGKPT